MATTFRRRRSFGGGKRPRKRAVWVNIPFGNVAFTETVGNQVLLVPEDWEASFTGLSIESATLRAIVGQIVIMPTTIGTAGGNMFWGIYMAGANETAVPVFTTSGMSEVIWLRTGCRGTSDSVSGNLAKAGNTLMEDIRIVAKRKLTSACKSPSAPSSVPTQLVLPGC